MPCRRYICSIFVALGVLASARAADDASRWNLPRFTADPATLNQTAASVNPKTGTDVIVLDEENSYVFDEEGKAVHTHYLVYKVMTQRGAEGWDSIDLGWQPWHEDRPTMRARVVTADNAIHSLDPKTITDAPARDEDDKTYGDGRVLRAPLPAIAPGSVVEEEEVFQEKGPFFGAGVVVREYFGRPVPVQNSKLVLDAPRSLPLRYELQLLPDMKPQKTEADGRQQIVFEMGAMEALGEAESYLPKEIAAQPQVTFSTGASWQAIADGYGKVVDEKASQKDVQAVVNGLISGKTGRDERAGAILQYISHEIRYTGVEFGDAAIVPHPPAETLKHKYGDCKDKATLAVAMLRGAGIPAYVALLNAGRRQDVESSLPGMGLFDHAIVFVPGSPEYWIDPTDEYARLGQIPRADQGRLSLVARSETTGLVTIPEASSRDNRIVETREFYLAENGPARIVEKTEVQGVFESEYRAAYAYADNKENKDALKKYVKEQYLAEKLTRFERSDPFDLSKSFHLELEAGDAKRGLTDMEVSVVAIRLESLFYKLPQELQETQREATKDSDDPQENAKKTRAADYQLPFAYVYEWQYKIVPPMGFQAKPLPLNADMPLGPARLTEEFNLENDGSVRAVVRFDTVKRQLTSSEANELREKVVQLRGGQAILVSFEPTTGPDESRKNTGSFSSQPRFYFSSSEGSGAPSAAGKIAACCWNGSCGQGGGSCRSEVGAWLRLGRENARRSFGIRPGRTTVTARERLWRSGSSFSRGKKT